MMLKSPWLVRFAAVGALPLLLVFPIGAPAQTLTQDIRVVSGNDDAEERLSGSMSRSSSDLELADDGTSKPNQTIGMRFLGIDVPPGATILDAHVQFQADETNSGVVDLEIWGQAAAAPATFSSSNSDITSRAVTSASIAWSPPAWDSVGAAGPDQRTPNLSAVVQEIIDHPDWAAGNPMVIIITGSGRRTAESYNGSSSRAPLLHIDYDPTPNAPPTASFTATPATGEAPLTVGFDAGASGDTDGTIESYEWDFGDGTTGTGATPSHDYLAGGSYDVTLTVTDDGAAAESATQTLEFTGNQAPTASFTHSTSSTDAPFTVDFDGPGSSDPDGGAMSYTWDYGDGATGTGATASHTYVADGTYAVTLSVTDDAGVSDSTTQTLTLAGNQAPTASFTATPVLGTAPLATMLDASASTDPEGGALGYAWDYGNGSTGTGAQANYVYGTPGSYTVTLTVTDDVGKTGTTSMAVTATVAGPIDIRVASGSDDAEESQSGSMSRSSSDLELADDGTKSPNQTIGMRFLGIDVPPGSKILNAHVQFQADETSSGSVDLEIRGQDTAAPAAFSSSSGDITSRPMTAESVAWSPPAWTSVGAAGPDQRTPDLSAVVQEIIDHPDWAAGNPMAIIITGSGRRTAASYNGSSSGAPLLHIDYDPTPNEAPTASFTATPGTGEVPLTVAFDGGASGDTDGTIASYAWDYGDGATGSGATPSHAYLAGGSHDVTLTVTDDGGATGSATQTLEFTGNQAPTASFAHSTSSIDAPFTVDFDASGSNDPEAGALSYAWNFGGGATGSGAITSHPFDTDGTYSVTLTVTDAAGASGSATQSLTLVSNQAPTASFTATPVAGVAPLAISLDGSASIDPEGGAMSHAWDYGNSATGSGATANYVYGTPGTYSVTLTVTDDVGKIGTASANVTVYDPTATQPLKVAFIGDQGSGSDPVDVLNLIAAEGADMVLISGDFDYNNSPDSWDGKLTDALGADFPVFASPGNHDTDSWGGSNGYQAKLMTRLSKIPEASCTGELGVQSACTYRGLFFILSGAGTIPNDEDNASHIAFITDQLAQSGAPFRICSGHKVQTKFQLGYRGNEVGWGPYEACREGGAIVATAHNHVYARTHLLDDFENQSIASTSNTLVIEKGKSFVFISGLGGATVNGQSQNEPWWAATHTSDQGANFGALFCTFFPNGDPTRASCYFKDLDGTVPDQFEIVSAIAGLVADFSATPVRARRRWRSTSTPRRRSPSRGPSPPMTGTSATERPVPAKPSVTNSTRSERTR